MGSLGGFAELRLSEFCGAFCEFFACFGVGMVRGIMAGVACVETAGLCDRRVFFVAAGLCDRRVFV